MTIRRLFEGLFLLALVAIGAWETTDPDLWWHLRTGELIWQSGIPQQDVFSFTVVGQAWITHEWLSQAIMWGIYQLGGLPALILFFALLMSATFYLIYRCCAGQPYLAVFVNLLAAIVCTIVWGARPQIFNLLFLAIYVYVIESVRQNRLSVRFLWLIPFLSLIWANLHSGYWVGIALLGSYTVGMMVEKLTNKGKKFVEELSLRGLLGVTIASFLAAALNPSGTALWLYPFDTLGSQAMQQYIQEWHSPNFHVLIFWAFPILMMLGVLGWARSGQSVTVTELLLFLGTFAAGLLSARHIPIFAVVATPIVCRHLLATTQPYPALHRFLTTGQKGVRGVPALNWILFLLAVIGVMGWVGQKVLDNDQTIAEHYPVAAVDFLIENGLGEAHGYNNYGWGGYLIWRGLPVFVDGRADVYGDSFLFDYLKSYEPQPDWRKPLDDFAVDYVLMEQDATLLTLLATQPDWQLFYSDDLAQIFIRRE